MPLNGAFELAPVVKDAPTDEPDVRGCRVMWPWAYRINHGDDMDIPDLQRGGKHAKGHSPDAIRWPDLRDKATKLRLAPGAKSPAGPEDPSSTPSESRMGTGSGDGGPAGQTTSGGDAASMTVAPAGNSDGAA